MVQLMSVDTQGTAPWNIEVQIVGPKGSENVPFRDIKTAKKKLSLPIPKAIDKDGGSFEVELGTFVDIISGGIVSQTHGM